MLRMIQATTTYTCRRCNSINITKNGTNKSGNAQYHCKDCGAYLVLEPKHGYSAEQKAQVLAGYQERMSLRGAQRVFGVWRQTIMKWLKAHVDQLPEPAQTLVMTRPDDVLEFDETWSFVAQRDNQRWLWTVLCRRTRQIVAFVIGDHSQTTCWQLWQAIPELYRHCRSYSDFWRAYAAVLPSETHQCVGKETGQTAHQERWYCTLRQRLARYVRQTLSFSKKDVHHDLVTRWFITEYNLHIRSSLTA
jgi:IS1 family transposase/transposase-like protein